MADTCNSRSLSWLAKTCLPDPRREISKPIQPPALENHRRVAAGGVSPILSLPDDLLLECLSRAPLSSLSMLPLVCRRFSALVDSPAFPTIRRARGRLCRSLLALSLPDPAILLATSLPLAGDGEPITSCSLSAVPLPSPAIATGASFRLAAVGRAVYLIGRTTTLRYDALTGALSPRAPTLFPRKKFAAAAVGGRIYVAGGSTSPAVEEYDPATDTWRVVAEAPRRRYGCVGAAAGGVFYVAGGLGVGGGAGRFDAHVCAGSMDGYHVGTGAWVRATRAAAVPGGGCVVGAVGVGSHVYVLASHAVEVSFWRWEGGKGGRRGGGEWARLEPPPMPSRSRFGRGSAVRFSCAAVGEERVVAAAHVPGGGAGGEGAEGVVMVYDVAGGGWARGPNLPPGLRRPALAAVEC